MVDAHTRGDVTLPADSGMQFASAYPSTTVRDLERVHTPIGCGPAQVLTVASMPDIFVSYASEDRDRVQPLVTALEDRGWTVWWDRAIHTGSRFDATIEEAIGSARCIVVVWSRNSIAKDWVRTEANEGLERSVLLPVLIDDVRPPLAFRRSQTASMIGWPVEQGGLANLVDGITKFLGGLPVSVPSKAAGVEQSVAVLPFVNMSSDPEQEYFADGITDDLIDCLVHVQDLKVVARTSSFRYKGTKDDVREIARQLGVSHVVEGSVRRAGDRVRITVQLIEATNGTHLWSERYDRTLSDVFALQDEITAVVTQALANALRPTLRNTHRPTPEAYDARLRGLHWLHGLSYGAARRALDCFERATQADPQFALAYANGAAAAFLKHALSSNHDPGDLRHGSQLVETALRLEPQLLEAQVIKSGSRMRLDQDLRGAVASIAAIRAAHPRHPAVLQEICRLLAYTPDLHALEHFAHALIDAEPHATWGYFWLSVVHSANADWMSLDRTCDLLDTIDPGNRLVLSLRATSGATRGNFDDAHAILRTNSLEMWPQAAIIHAMQGDRDRALNVVRGFKDQPGMKAWLADCYAFLDDIDGVVIAARAAVTNRDPQLFHLTGSLLGPGRSISGQPVTEIFAHPRVQDELRTVGLDRETVASVDLSVLGTP